MRKLILSTFLIACCAALATAQTNDELNRFEIFAGYSHLFVEDSAAEINRNDEAESLKDYLNWMKGDATRRHGVNLSATGNLKRYFGLKLDFSTYGNRTKYAESTYLPEAMMRPTLTMRPLSNSFYNFMGGVQLKDNNKQKTFKPFAHFLFGRVLEREEQQLDFYDPDSREFLYSNRLTVNSTGFAGTAGGGLDVKFNDRLDLRLVQIDLYRSNIGSSRLTGLRMGIGVVFR